MFYSLRKLIITVWSVLWAGLVCYGAFLLYEQRGRLEPLVDYYALWREHRDASPVGLLEGTVTRVFTGTTIQLRTADRAAFNLALSGVSAPPFRLGDPDAQRDRARRSQAALRGLVLSNQVTMRLTAIAADRTGAGILLLRGTNVNRLLASQGWVTVNRQGLDGFTLREKFDLVQAGRRAQSAGRNR
jgi:endonuclease YncB( thermonuclease family)